MAGELIQNTGTGIIEKGEIGAKLKDCAIIPEV